MSVGVDWGRALWVLGGYLAGTLPSTWIAARLTGAGELLAAADRRSGEADPHVLGVRHMGWPATVAATVTDVSKAFFYALVARAAGNLDPAWTALVGVALVLGHSFPFYARRMAGRGMAASSGVFLILLPIEMIVAGTAIVLGMAARETGLAATLGLFSVPAVAAIQGQPWPLVAMAAAIVLLIVLRRLEGIRAVIQAGVSPGKAVLYRCLFDSSGPPSPRPAGSGPEP